MTTVTAEQAAREVRRSPATIRYWVHRGWLAPVARAGRSHLYDLGHVFTVERDARNRQRAARRSGPQS